ncbi:hypothetical protein C8R44DRAFT_987528 [Mycena epipterygia]|nr:hypothetical protein C8R44DRAFT_987528 [Mycena epipterygia]
MSVRTISSHMGFYSCLAPEQPLEVQAMWKDWHTSPEIKFPLSCDWGSWDGVWFYFDHGYGAEITHHLNGPFRLPATTVPLAYWALGRGQFDIFLFACAGKYYYYDECGEGIRWYHGKYESHDDFLRRYAGEDYTMLFPQEEKQEIVTFGRK